MQPVHLESEHVAEIAIIGGGIVALSIAWELVRRHPKLRIALIAPAGETGSASHAAGAMLSGYGETTALSLKSEAGRAKVEWRIESARLWRTWADRLRDASHDDSLRLQSGTIMIMNSVSGPLDQRNFQATVELLEKRGERFSRIDPVRDTGMSPSMADRPMQAIHIPDECHVESSRVLAALQTVLRSADSVTWFDAQCIGISPSPGRPGSYKVTTAQTAISVPLVIVAAGVNSLRQMENCGNLALNIPPLLAGQGTAIQCTPQREPLSLPAAIRTPNRAFACGLHALSQGKSGLYVGATNNMQAKPAYRAVMSDVSFVIDCAVNQIDRRIASHSVEEIRVGNRPVSADTFPLIGETSSPGLWLASGTYRDGFLMAPLLAERLVDAIETRKPKLAGAELFVPERAPLACADLNTAIEEGVENYMAIALERKMRLPSVGNWEDDFRAQIDLKVRRLYSSVGGDYIVPPDFLWDIEHGDLLGFFQNYCQGAAISRNSP